MGDSLKKLSPRYKLLFWIAGNGNPIELEHIYVTLQDADDARYEVCRQKPGDARCVVLPIWVEI